MRLCDARPRARVCMCVCVSVRMQKCIPIHRARILHLMQSSQTPTECSLRTMYVCKNARLDVVGCAITRAFVNSIVRAHRYRSSPTISVAACLLQRVEHHRPMHHGLCTACIEYLPLSFVRSAPAVVKCESVGLFKHMYAESEFTRKTVKREKERERQRKQL